MSTLVYIRTLVQYQRGEEFAMNAQANAKNNKVQHHKIAIIGTGFAGLGMAIQLKKSGERDFILFEREAGVGGTWRVNHYPGCACDVQSHLYSFSFEPNPKWSRMYAPQAEIKAYLEACADKYHLMPYIRLNTPIMSARWDDAANLWRLEDTQGNQYTANVLISGMGGLSTPAFPKINGLESFKGKVFHSQQWDHDYDLTGKRVAVIGTGASAIQFVPQIQPKVARLDLYQRTPPWILPKPDRPITAAEQTLFKLVPAAQQAMRAAIYTTLEARVAGFTINPQLMVIAKRWALNHIRTQIQEPELRRKVTPDYTIGCKRILLSNDYYPALDQPNVDVITTGIQEVRAHSVVTADGQERQVDAIILGTGFAATDPAPPTLVFGRNGVDLAELWKSGPEAYKCTTVAGFPNLFFIVGPNTGLGHSSMVYMIESQITYILDALQQMEKRRVQVIEVKSEVQADFNRKIHRQLNGSVWNTGGCMSWYRHPVSGKNTSLWPSYTWRFRQITKNFDAPAYHLISRSPQPAPEEHPLSEPLTNI